MQTSHRLIHWSGAVFAAAGYAAIAVQVVRLWLDPMAWGDERWIGYTPRLLMGEFALLGITLVAAGLCTVVSKLIYKILISAGLLLLFFGPSIFVAHMLGDEPLLDYLLLLIVARFLVLVSSSASGYEDLLGHSAIALVIFFFVMLGMLLVTAVLPMPLGGIDDALLKRIIPWEAETPWDREPQRSIATIVVYCVAMVAVELLLIGPARYHHAMQHGEGFRKT
ncbi:MAG TPA: hypothetical protein VFY12_12225 [Arenimonas sp.]|nr:hypothetical protein [Arenimonas sp.]